MEVARRQTSGFILVTSLLFLVVLTLLGVSAMSSISLQEQMAANLKEKERATEAAEVANREAEEFIASRVNPPVPNNANGRVRILNTDRNPVLDSSWDNAFILNTPPFNADNIGTGDANRYADTPVSLIEEFRFVPYTLNPEDTATGAGRFYYRIGARGVGGNPNAVSVVESIYQKRFR